MIASLWHEILEHSVGIAGILTAIVALLGLGWKVMSSLRKEIREGNEKVMADNDQRYRRFLKGLADRMVRNATEFPDRHLTFDLSLPDQTILRIPVPEHDWCEVLPGMWLTQGGQTTEETTIILRTLGSVSLPWHFHERQESITVVRGTMTDRQTGTVYNPGEEWVIPRGRKHIGDFHNVLVVIRLRPPLKTADKDPPQLEGIQNVADHLEEGSLLAANLQPQTP